ncbi:limbic system-associated membrane protein [Phlebotomus argentipes]|uniref:limbic system-associated membrane protein n=1 Tax=Phlebotomus argentipes TaxID=94469 RepID=UPI0028931C74|nr:limbic system-associated membrane protein [Phlebotomus argentipes]
MTSMDRSKMFAKLILALLNVLAGQHQPGVCQDMGDGGVPTVLPKFISRGNLYKVTTGDTVTLPCRVQNLGTFILLWRRGSSVLTAGPLMITRDNRFKLADPYDLQIHGVKTQDAGDYICQIGDQETRDQVHTLEILVPPTVRAVPQNGQVTARKGSTVTLECKASGNPVPSVFWYKRDPLAGSTHLSDSSTLVLERVERQHAGVYLCAADNGVREPVSADVQLTVLSPPEITVEKSWVHASEGHDVELCCTVHGDSSSEMLWFQNSFLLDPTDRRTMHSVGEQYILSIRNFQTSDFGNYSCVADNSLGRTKKYIEVSGRPGPATFLSPAYSGFLDVYNLTWNVESIPPLEEVRLLYRKLLMNDTYQHPGKWHDVVLVPTPTRSAPNHFIMSHIIKGLERNSVYEAIIQAKNRYGWNEISDIHQFYTRNSETPAEDVDFMMSSTSGAARIDWGGAAAALLMALQSLRRWIIAS